MGRSRRSRRRGGHSPWWIVCLTVLIVSSAFGVGGYTGSAAFTAAASDRGASVTVAEDNQGLLGIDAAERVTAGSESRLVTVTNNLDRTVVVVVDSSATLSNRQASLSPSESVTTTTTVSCSSPPSELQLTITASADERFSGLATRSVPVDTSGCTDSTLGFGTLIVVDQSTSAKGGKAEYAVNYRLTGDTGSFDRVRVGFENLDRTTGVKTKMSTTQVGVISFESGGQRFGERFEITVRLFDDAGEQQRERVVVTDTADGSGTVYTAP